MLNSPMSPWPSFTEEEAEAVSKVLLSNRVNYWTGDECRQFEAEFAQWTGSEHAICLANGTLALDLALHGLGIGSRNGGLCTDEVVVTPRTFLASVSSVVNAGAIPVFADVDRDSGNLTAETIAEVVAPNTKAVVVVHLAGWPCDMDPIMQLASCHGIKVIEDCAQAHGAVYKGRSVGSIGHVGAWSFCQDKIMTTGGEGGMVTTNDSDTWQKMWSFKDHGKSYEAVYGREHPPGFHWLHEGFGTNWRMTEMQAILGRIQLKRMPTWHQARRDNAAKLNATLRCQSLDTLAVRVPTLNCSTSKTSCSKCSCRHAYYKYYAYVRPENLKKGWNRNRILHEIEAQGVPCRQGSCPEVYLEKAFENSDWRPNNRLRVAKELGETSLMLLVHPTLTSSEIDKTCDVFINVIRRASSPK